MICKKCGALGSITLRKKDIYCDICFSTNIVHKFRGCIGKNKILSKDENALICLSGGKGSTVLIDLIHNGIVLDNHKKLRIRPFFLHISIGDEDLINNIIKQCKLYGFHVYIANIADYFEPYLKIPNVNSLPNINSENKEKINNMFKDIPLSVYNDIMIKIKRSLFIKYAKLLDCELIFTAETTTSLAINLLSNISIGRGSQIESDIGFIDDRDEIIKIIRPMKDISQEELDNFIRIKQLRPIHFNHHQETSIQSVISNFVGDLQENFPATVSTVCKTADKIGLHNGRKIVKNMKCILCESDLNTKDLKLSALEATEFSRLVSLMKPQSTPINIYNILHSEDPAMSDECSGVPHKYCVLNSEFCAAMLPFMGGRIADHQASGMLVSLFSNNKKENK